MYVDVSLDDLRSGKLNYKTEYIALSKAMVLTISGHYYGFLGVVVTVSLGVSVSVENKDLNC